MSSLSVDAKYWKEILKLGMTIVPLVDDKLLTGIIALEFDSTEAAIWNVERIKQQKDLRRFVAESLLRIWQDRIGYFQTMVGTLNAHIWRRAENENRVSSWKDVLDYIRIGPYLAQSGAKTIGLQPEELFNGLAKDTLQRTEPVGAECSLKDVCEEWRSFIQSRGKGQLTTKIVEKAKLMAMPPALRMMLASATAVVLWGGKAELSLLEGNDPGWTGLQIEVSSNGNGNKVIRQQGLDLARGITILKGWAYEEAENGSIIVNLPRL